MLFYISVTSLIICWQLFAGATYVDNPRRGIFFMLLGYSLSFVEMVTLLYDYLPGLNTSTNEVQWAVLAIYILIGIMYSIFLSAMTTLIIEMFHLTSSESTMTMSSSHEQSQSPQE